jgi:protein gp37
MARTTGIEWTDATWNPIRGCSRVSEGCRHCYAETVANRFSGPGKPYEGLVQIDPATGKGNGKWNGQIKFVEKHLLDPLGMKTPLRIFVNSMSDLFHEAVTEEMLDRIFAVMALCPQHTFQLLTKRPERMFAYLTGGWHARVAAVVNSYTGKLGWHKGGLVPVDAMGLAKGFIVGMPLPNVHLGVSVEDQKAAVKRIPLLLATPAAVRFISAEPLLGDLDLRRLDWVEEMIRFYTREAAKGGEFAYMFSELAEQMKAAESFENDRPWRDVLTGAWFDGCDGDDNPEPQHRTLDWVIVGGESGPGARPMHPDWARSLRDQCVVAGVPFFFKQWGEWLPFSQRQPGQLRDSVSHDLAIFGSAGVWRTGKDGCWRVGKRVAGDLLDGRQWHEFPNVKGVST